MLDFAKRVLAAAWARFALSVVADLNGFGSAKRVLAAVWAGFAPSGLVEVRGCIRPKRALAAVWVGFAPSGLTQAWRWISQNVLWLQPGHVLHSISLSV